MKKTAIASDVDGTLWAGDGILDILGQYGKRKRAELIWKMSRENPAGLAKMLGLEQSRIYPSFDVEWVLEEIRKTQPIPLDVFKAVADSVDFFPFVVSAFETFKGLGVTPYLLSTGYQPFLERICERLSIPKASGIGTLLKTRGGAVVGFAGPVMEGKEKESAVRRISRKTGIPLARFVGIGDGAGDKWFLKAISDAGGLAIAVSEDEELQAYANPGVSMKKPDFEKIIFEIEKFAKGD